MNAAKITAVIVLLVGSSGFREAPVAETAESSLWDALRSGGHAALLRHAIAPGTGDPVNFQLGDCTTQRNLSTEGRGQAARIGVRMRAAGIARASVLTSQWCRCRETAQQLKLGSVEELPLLNSFFRHSDRREPQTHALRTWLANQDFTKLLILVTHQVNITALTGVIPASGELVIIRWSDADGIEVIGTINTE